MKFDVNERRRLFKQLRYVVMPTRYSYSAFLWILAAASLLAGCDKRSMGPASESFITTVIIDDRISDESYRSWRFDLPSGGRGFKLEGWFNVTSGGNRDINAYVVDAREYLNFKRGTNFYSLYTRRRVGTGEFEVPLDRKAGPYYFILSNRFSLFTDKWVEGAIELTY